MKTIRWIVTVLLIATFALFAIGSGESKTEDQGNGSAGEKETVAGSIGSYSVVIDSCRLAKDYEGKNVVIVKYKFTNVSGEEPVAFYTTFEDEVFQDGVGLNRAYVLKDSAKYNEDNQTKQIKKGASLDVEVAYELNDKETDIEVEVSELFSFDNTTIKKTFSIKK